MQKRNTLYSYLLTLYMNRHLIKTLKTITHSALAQKAGLELAPDEHFL